VLEAGEQRLQCLVVLLAAGVAVLLVLADRANVKTSQAGNQHID